MHHFLLKGDAGQDVMDNQLPVEIGQADTKVPAPEDRDKPIGVEELTGFYQKTKSLCLVVTLLVIYKTYTIYQSTYFIDVFIQGMIKNRKKSRKSIKHIKRYAQNKFQH